MSEEYVLLSDLGEISERLPVGEYNFKMLTIDAGLSKAEKPMLTCTYQVIDGDQAGAEIKAWYSLSGAKSAKNGKMYYRGISEIVKMLAAIGVPLSTDTRFPTEPNAAAKIVGRAFKGKQVTGVVYTETYEKDGEKKEATKIRITGLKRQAVAASAVSGSSVEDDF